MITHKDTFYHCIKFRWLAPSSLATIAALCGFRLPHSLFRYPPTEYFPGLIKICGGGTLPSTVASRSAYQLPPFFRTRYRVIKVSLYLSLALTGSGPRLASVLLSIIPNW